MQDGGENANGPKVARASARYSNRSHFGRYLWNNCTIMGRIYLQRNFLCMEYESSSRMQMAAAAKILTVEKWRASVRYIECIEHSLAILSVKISRQID